MACNAYSIDWAHYISRVFIMKKMMLTAVAVMTTTVMMAAGVAAMVVAVGIATAKVMTAVAAWGVKRQQSTSNPTHCHHRHCLL